MTWPAKKRNAGTSPGARFTLRSSPSPAVPHGRRSTLPPPFQAAPPSSPFRYAPGSRGGPAVPPARFSFTNIPGSGAAPRLARPRRAAAPHGQGGAGVAYPRPAVIAAPGAPGAAPCPPLAWVGDGPPGRPGNATGEASLDRGRIKLPPPPHDLPKYHVHRGEKEPAEERQRARKRLRNRAGRALWKPGKDLSQQERVCACGRYLSRAMEHGDTSYAAIKRHEDGAFLSGVVTCGSVWMCADCAARISRGRQKEMARLVKVHGAKGGVVAMLTLTLPHTSYDDLKVLRRDVAALWTKVIAGNPWKRAMERAHVLGGFRALEVTHGGNGWHPHLHVLVFFDGPETRVAEFMDWTVSRWITVAGRRGYSCSPAAQKWEIAKTPEGAGDYLTKWGVDWEITHAHLKRAKGESRSGFQILADYARTGDPADKALFCHYALRFKGARQLTEFGGVRAKYGEQNLTDEGVLTAEEAKAETICYLASYTFDAIRRRDLEVDVLIAAETGGLFGVINLLTLVGIGASGVKRPEFGARLRTYGNRAFDPG